MPRLLLIRHGESEWNAIGRWQGRADPPLSERGRRQALLAGDVLGAVDAVVTSPLQRAAHTAELISEATGVGPVMIDPDLQERDAGEWQGLTRAEIEERWPGFLADRRRPPGYEADHLLLERIHRALERTARRVAGDDVLVVTHGGVVNALEASFGLPWERLPNLGGRWLRWERDQVEIGERIQLVHHEHVTVQERDQL